ncbi:hypothetical protein AVEN_75195-1 [Araneus ventricosus]|uniref:Uncharacterized protein n=1 Tax=Araneus ventricosus TaxID=182803 RepID=A0A4Y2VA61_ARAVE|nr:hypothetical protein AVEN_75195-1 [Araneus ventricosus]
MRFLLDEDEPNNTIDSPTYIKNVALSTESLFYVEHFKEIEMLLTTQSHDLREEGYGYREIYRHCSSADGCSTAEEKYLVEEGAAYGYNDSRAVRCACTNRNS